LEIYTTEHTEGAEFLFSFFLSVLCELRENIFFTTKEKKVLQRDAKGESARAIIYHGSQEGHRDRGPLILSWLKP
jgi:hypothetical protein